MQETYIIEPVNIQDGEINWNIANTVKLNEFLWLPKTQISAEASLLYDATGIYVRLHADEKKIRANYTGTYDMVCEDSCLEFFFCPVCGDMRYFNMEVNPNGAYYLGFGYNNAENVRLIVPEGNKLFQIKAVQRKEEWVVEYKLPVSFIRTFIPDFKLEKGMELSGNFYKCGDLTDTPHYIAWNKINSDIPDFHRPDYFGKLLFH